MTLYHSTTPEAAMEILASGFKDGTGRYLTDHEFSGVWLSDSPLDENEGCKGSTVLIVSGLDESKIADYEWVEEGKGYREWLIPAAILNGNVTVELVSNAVAPVPLELLEADRELTDILDIFDSLQACHVIALLRNKRNEGSLQPTWEYRQMSCPVC